MKTIFTALFLLTTTVPALANTTCVAPSVRSARVNNIAHDGNLNHYLVEMVVSNVTNSAQASNTLQFVDIYNDRQKLDAIGVPPLRPGASYTAYYTFTRSSDAGDGTTDLKLRTRMVQPACDTAPARTVTF